MEPPAWGNPSPCGHIATAQLWSLRKAGESCAGARCTYCDSPGLPSLSFLLNLSVSVASFAQKPLPWQSHRLSESLRSPAHGAASVTQFQVVSKNSFSRKRVPQRRELGDPGEQQGPGGGGVPSRAEPGPGLCPPPLPFQPLPRRERPGGSAPIPLQRVRLVAWDERYLHL